MAQLESKSQSHVALLSAPIRVVLTAGVLVAAFGIYFFWPSSEPSTTEPTRLAPAAAERPPLVSPRMAGGAAEQFYDENLPHWDSFEYVSLTNPELVASAVQVMVRGRYDKNPIDEALLARDLTKFLVALAANSPDEYLAKMAPNHRLRTAHELFNDEAMHHRYRELAGRKMTATDDPQSTLSLVWNGGTEGAARPLFVSTRALVEVATSNPRPAHMEAGWSLPVATFPKFIMSDDPECLRWCGPAAMGFFRLTAPTVSFEEVISQIGRAKTCLAYFAVRTADGQTIPMSVYFYFVPEQELWCIAFGTLYYPYRVTWPL